MHEINKYISDGDKINLLVQNNYEKHQYVSKVDHINEDGTVDVLIPISKNQIVFIKVDTIIKVIVSKEGAIFEFRAQVIDKLFGTIPLLRLLLVSEIHKIQRRNYYRLKALENIKVRKIIDLKEKQFDEYFEAAMVDISGGGLAFNSKVELEVKAAVELSLKLNGNALNIIGTIVRVDLDESKARKYSYGVNFEKITEIERNIIMKYIFEEQRKLAKKGLI